MWLCLYLFLGLCWTKTDPHCSSACSISRGRRQSFFTFLWNRSYANPVARCNRPKIWYNPETSLLALWISFPKISCQSEAYKMVNHNKLCGRVLLISPWSLRTVNKQTESSLLWLMSIQCNSNYTRQRPLLSYHHFSPDVILKERMRKAFTPCLQVLAQSHKALPPRNMEKLSTKVKRSKFKKPKHSSCSPGGQYMSYLQWISQRQDSQWLPL